MITSKQLIKYVIEGRYYIKELIKLIERKNHQYGKLSNKYAELKQKHEVINEIEFGLAFNDYKNLRREFLAYNDETLYSYLARLAKHIERDNKR